MRILMLTQSYPPAIGGTERHVYDLSIELVARGYDVAVVTLLQEGAPDFQCDQGVRIYRVLSSFQRLPAYLIDKRQPHAPPFPDPEVMQALRHIIVYERPDIVHAHNWMVHSFTPLKEWSKSKLIVSLHDCSRVCAKQAFVHHSSLCTGPAPMKCLECAIDHYGIAKGVSISLGGWMWKQVGRQAIDMFLPVSDAVAHVSQLVELGLPYHVIPNFLPDYWNMSATHSDLLLEQLPGEDFLLFVGNIGRDKGIEVLLRAYSALGTQMPLVLIGRAGPGYPTHFPPNVHVLQSWPHSSIMRAWQRCTIALVPSICLEAFGIVALEAMSMGKPVIATHVGGLPEIVIDGETGLLVSPGDWHGLQMAIKTLLDDQTQREYMGVRASHRAREFQAHMVIPQIEQIYQEVLHL